MPFSRRSAVWATAALASVGTACSLFVSLDDLQDGGTSADALDASTDVTTTTDAASTCDAALDTDPSNCGACGHACGKENAKTTTCAAGKCVFQCNTGFDNCDGDGAHGCETALTSDNARACGSCGRDCLEGTCVNFACTPVVLFSAPAGQGINGIAVDGERIYWTQDYDGNLGNDAGACTSPEGGVFESALDGGGRALLAPNEHPIEIGLDDAGVYWKSNDLCGTTVKGSFKRIGKDGKCSTGACPSTVVGGLGYFTSDLGVGAGNVYFLDGTNNFLYAVPSGGAPSPTNIASGFHAYEEQLATDPVGVVWTAEKNDTAGPAILGLTIGSDGSSTEGKKVLASPATKPSGIASDGTTVFFGTTDSIYSVPRGGGTATKLAGSQAPYALAVDDVAVYWSDASSIRRIGKDGKCRSTATSCPELVAPATQPHDIAVDGVAVYWLDADVVKKVGK